jgi:hypothetical protein
LKYLFDLPRKIQRRGSGRPAGSQKNPEGRAFVHGLLTAVDRVGGKLIFNKNHPGRSTLLPALRLLKPYVPDGVTNLSHALLAETCATWRADRKLTVARPIT